MCTRTYIVTAFSVLLASLAFQEMARARSPFGDIGKSIEKSVQDVGKAIEKGGQDTGKTIDKGRPAIEHSPSDPCKINDKLPQCDLDKAQK
jgi:hypothetical protein